MSSVTTFRMCGKVDEVEVDDMFEDRGLQEKIVARLVNAARNSPGACGVSVSVWLRTFDDGSLYLSLE